MTKNQEDFCHENKDSDLQNDRRRVFFFQNRRVQSEVRLMFSEDCHFVEWVFGESAAERWGWSLPFCGCESRSPNRSWPRIRRTRSLCWAVARFRSMQLG